MSVVLGTECPHCRHWVAAEYVAEWNTQLDGQVMWTVAFKCVRCQFGIFAVAKPYHGSLRPSQGSGDIGVTPAFRVFETYPKIFEPTVPQFLPDNIGLFYREALDNEVRENWNSCGSMCRKVLDVATKDLGADPKDRMFIRLDKLVELGKVTPDLKKWGQAIWKDGNDASHDSDPFTEKEAHQIRSFTELFLMYVYTLPKMLDERKTATQSDTP
ncbi:MAG: DUF4145 domain-containing protein [Leptospirillum sp.]